MGRTCAHHLAAVLTVLELEVVVGNVLAFDEFFTNG